MDRNAAQDTAAGIAEYFKSQRAARDAKIPRPGILDEVPPSDRARLAGWKALREQGEEQYTQALLGKKALTADEQQFLLREIQKHLRATS